MPAVHSVLILFYITTPHTLHLFEALQPTRAERQGLWGATGAIEVETAPHTPPCTQPTLPTLLVHALCVFIYYSN